MVLRSRLRHKNEFPLRHPSSRGERLSNGCPCVALRSGDRRRPGAFPCMSRGGKAIGRHKESGARRSRLDAVPARIGPKRSGQTCKVDVSAPVFERSSKPTGVLSTLPGPPEPERR